MQVMHRVAIVHVCEWYHTIVINIQIFFSIYIASQHTEALSSLNLFREQNYTALNSSPINRPPSNMPA